MISVNHFVFTRHRAGAADLVFRPDGGASLSYVSMFDDTLTLSNMRTGVLQFGDNVSVSRGGAVVFRGDVADADWHGWRGTSTENSFSVRGPWSRLSRLPYTQTWMMMVEREVDGETVSSLEPVGSSRIVLNQDDDGDPVTIQTQVMSILAAAAAAGIIAQPSPGDVSALPSMTLPYDESRDLTCAQALARELRFTPAIAVRFDYSQNPPALRILAPGAQNADWLADFALAGALLDVREKQTGLPPLGCLLEITVTGSVEGTAYAFSSFQAAGNTADPERTLRAVLPVSGLDLSSDRRKLDLTTADIPADLKSTDFWREWHSDLKLLPANSISIIDASRTGGGDLTLYPRFVTKAGVGMQELEEAGIAHFRIERLLCTVVVTTTVYIEGRGTIEHVETADLSLEIIACDAETKTYHWTVASDSLSAETVPAGLASALLSAHQADGLSAEVLCALPTDASLPLIGDTRNGLTARAVAVDCRTLSASVSFGPPAALGPVDLAGFLSGFRNIRRSAAATRRNTGEVPSGAESDETFLLPSTSSGWIKKGDNKLEVAAANGAGAKASVDPSELDPGKDAKFRDINYTAADGSVRTAKVLASDPVDDEVTETDIIIYCKQFSLSGKLLSKTVGETETFFGIKITGKTNYTSSDKRLLLQVTEPSTGTFAMDLSKGYLKS